MYGKVVNLRVLRDKFLNSWKRQMWLEVKTSPSAQNEKVIIQNQGLCCWCGNETVFWVKELQVWQFFPNIFQQFINYAMTIFHHNYFKSWTIFNEWSSWKRSWALMLCQTKASEVFCSLGKNLQLFFQDCWISFSGKRDDLDGFQSGKTVARKSQFELIWKIFNKQIFQSLHLNAACLTLIYRVSKTENAHRSKYNFVPIAGNRRVID